MIYNPAEGCAPGPDYIDPFNELARRDPLIAVAIRLASDSGRDSADAQNSSHRRYQLEEDLKTVRRDLDDAERQTRYLRRDLGEVTVERDAAEAKVERLEKRLKPKAKKVTKTKKGKK